jgi:predicted SpoU family rRNA methylase
MISGQKLRQQVEVVSAYNIDIGMQPHWQGCTAVFVTQAVFWETF